MEPAFLLFRPFPSLFSGNYDGGVDWRQSLSPWSLRLSCGRQHALATFSSRSASFVELIVHRIVQVRNSSQQTLLIPAQTDRMTSVEVFGVRKALMLDSFGKARRSYSFEVRNRPVSLVLSVSDLFIRLLGVLRLSFGSVGVSLTHWLLLIHEKRLFFVLLRLFFLLDQVCFSSFF